MKYGGSNMSGSNIARAGLLLASLTLAGSAQAASPFSALAGSWSGGGTLSTSDGMQEQLRCRASYNVAGTGAELRLNLRCASQSYNFDLAGDVQYQGGAISGSWSEASRNASGTISGRANGDHIDAAARGDSFSANLSLTTRGGRQTVTIRPQGTNVTAVSLALDRR
jgi:hypothetical protein